MQVNELEMLLARLQQVQQELRTTSRFLDRGLRPDDPLVIAVNECEVMLPATVTVHSLLDTVKRKIDDVAVLLDRARQHERLPIDAQAAAEQEDLLIEEDYLGAQKEPSEQEQPRPSL
jgi:hypothetical protein